MLLSCLFGVSFLPFDDGEEETRERQRKTVEGRRGQRNRESGVRKGEPK